MTLSSGLLSPGRWLPGSFEGAAEPAQVALLGRSPGEREGIYVTSQNQGREVLKKELRKT